MATTPPDRISYNVPTSGNYTTNTSPKTTNAFDVQAGDLIVVIGSTEDTSSSLNTPTATGGSITWTLQRSVTTSNYSHIRLWTGVVGATATGITVSVTRSGSTTHFWGFSATVYRNHGGVGVTNVANTTGAPSLALNDVQAASTLQAGVNDWNAVNGSSRTWRTVDGITPTPAVGGNGYETLYTFTSGRHTTYGAYWPTTSAGNKTVGLSAPTGQKFSIVGIEILGTDSASPITAAPSSISSTETFGTPTAQLTLTAQPSSISSAESIGTPTAVVAGVPQPTSIPSAETFGSPTAALTLTAQPSSISSAQALGTPTAALTLACQPTGIASGEAVGAPVVTGSIAVSPSGIASTQALGSPSVSGTVTLLPTGIASAQAFGTPVIVTGNQTTPSGIPSAESFGLVAVSSTLTTSPTAIPSVESFGVPGVTTSYLATPDGILSEEAFGVPTTTGGGTPPSDWTYWDGATESPVTLEGVWDGASVVPISFDSVV